MGNVAKLFPYREQGRLIMRGKIGNAGGNGVSRFKPIRVGGRMLLRGANSGLKVVYGYPARMGGRAFGRSIFSSTSPPLCDGVQAIRATVTVSGYALMRVHRYWVSPPATGCSGSPTHTCTTDATNVDGIYDLGVVLDCDWQKVLPGVWTHDCNGSSEPVQGSLVIHLKRYDYDATRWLWLVQVGFPFAFPLVLKSASQFDVTLPMPGDYACAAGSWVLNNSTNESGYETITYSGSPGMVHVELVAT